MSEAFSNALLGAKMEDEEFTLQTKAAPLGQLQIPDTSFDIRNPFTTGINSFNSTYRNVNAAWRAHTFVGQMATAYEAAQLVNEENNYDPDWDLWEHLTDSEKAAARASGYEELSALRTPEQLEQYRLVKAANGFYRDELSDANPATVFISSMFDIDALAPLGVTKGIGFVRGAVTGAAYTGVATGATETARISMDPEAKPDEILYASSALLIGGAFGGAIGRMKGKNAFDTIKAQEDLASKSVTKGDIEKAADSMDQVYEETLHHNDMGPRPEPRPEDIGPMEAEVRRILDEDVSPLSKEAEDYLSAAEAGMPAMVTKRLRRIAEKEGIEITDKTTPQDVVDALKKKKAAAALASRAKDSVLTDEAEKLINETDQVLAAYERLHGPEALKEHYYYKPTFVTPWMRKVAKENGIEVTNTTTPANIANALKKKKADAEQASRGPDPSDEILALDAEYKDALKGIEDGVDQPEYVFHVGSSGNKEIIYRDGLTAGGIQPGRPVDDYGYGDRVYVFLASDLPDNFKNFADVSGAGPSYKPVKPLFDISIDELPKFKSRRGYGPRAAELGDGPQPQDDLFDKEALIAVPGVGPKTAEKILLKLKSGTALSNREKEFLRQSGIEEPAARSEPETVLDAEDEVALNEVLQELDYFGYYKSVKGRALNEEEIDSAKKLYIDLVNANSSAIMRQAIKIARLGRKYGVLVGDDLVIEGADNYATLRNLETLAAGAKRRSDEEPPPWEEVPRGADPDTESFEMAAPEADGSSFRPAPASKFTPIEKDDGGLWQPKKNPLTRLAAQQGRQFPYMKNIENQFFEMGEDAIPLANKISQTAQKLGGTLLPNKNGEAEIGLMYRHHQLYKLMDDHLTQISEIYNAHRGRTAGKGGAARMMMSEVADSYQNLKGRAQGEGQKSRVKFTHEDYMNWIWYPAAYNFDFDATMSYGLKTIRERFAEEGWGQAEWDVLSKGSQEALGFFEKIGEMMDADAMKGSAAALKRAEQYEDYAVFLRERAVKHGKSRETVRDNEQAFKVLTEKDRVAFAESLEFDAAAISERLAAGDPEIAATMYASLVRVALKQHLETLRPIYAAIEAEYLTPAQKAGLEPKPRPDNPVTRIEDALKLDAKSPQDAVKMRKILDETLQVEGIDTADSAIIIDRRYDGNNPDEWTMREFNKRLEELETMLFHSTIKQGRDMPRRDPHYFARLLRPDIIDDPSIDKFLREEMFRAFQEDPTLRGKTLSQKEDAIKERVDNTINNMRRRGVRADTEGLLDEDTGLSPFVPKHEMSRRNPLRDRTLLMDGPGNSVLETDPRIVMNAYLNRVGPSMSMTREYGDPSAWRAIREIDYDAEDLAIEAMKKGDWETAAKIEREGREQVAALTDLRDGVLGTWGFHEDPTTLSARTLRTAKNIGVVTLMGRSGQMVAADAGRLMLAMKLKELGDMGLMAFKNPQEFGLAWNEIKMMGEIAEARSNLRTGWLLDATGGSMARASAFENFWQRLTGPTFVVSGLAPGTDMLKGITGVHTMSEIIRLSKAHAEGTIGLMSKELPNTIGEWTIVSMKGIPPQRGKKLGPYARANPNEKIIYYDEDKIRAAYKERRWASQDYLNNEGAPDPMPVDAFKTEEHWMRHVLLHEWMHTKFPRDRGESIKAYENRINQEAFNRLPYHNPPEKGEIDMADRLKELGITDDLARRINEQWEKAGSQGPGNGADHLFIANSEKWDDQEVIDLFRGAVSQEINKIIITPNITTRPKFMSTNLWSYLLQFKSFPIAASFAATARMIQSPKEKRIRRMALGMLAGGFLVQNLRASPFDEDDIDKYMRVVDYSGVVPLFSEINNITELLTAGTVGMRPLFGSESVLRDVNVAEQFGPFLGPVGGSVLRLGGTLPEGDLGEITKAATRFVPWMNHPANFFPGFMRGLGEMAEGEE